jgi:hypothetical protein
LRQRKEGKREKAESRKDKASQHELHKSETKAFCHKDTKAHRVPPGAVKKSITEDKKR